MNTKLPRVRWDHPVTALRRPGAHSGTLAGDPIHVYMQVHPGEAGGRSWYRVTVSYRGKDRHAQGYRGGVAGAATAARELIAEVKIQKEEDR